jgi:hypothetical protein
VHTQGTQSEHRRIDILALPHVLSRPFLGKMPLDQFVHIALSPAMRAAPMKQLGLVMLELLDVLLT